MPAAHHVLAHARREPRAASALRDGHNLEARHAPATERRRVLAEEESHQAALVGGGHAKQAGCQSNHDHHEDAREREGDESQLEHRAQVVLARERLQLWLWAHGSVYFLSLIHI